MNLNKAKQLCRSFPGVTEEIKWDHVLVYCVGGKMFAATDNDEEARRLSLKVEDDAFLALTDRPGFVPAPYLARAKWVMIDDFKAVSDAEAASLLRRAYELIFAKLTKKLQREIGATP